MAMGIAQTGDRTQGQLSGAREGARARRFLGLDALGFLGFLVVLAALLACRSRTTEIVVFYASSLSAVLGDAAAAFQQQNPGYRLRLEPSGSQVAARKVAELGMRADLVAVADAGLIPKMMIPGHASWSVTFATNEVVLAHKDHSRFTDQITAANWAEVLLRDGVRLGRADPDTAPIGYQTLMVWQLAEAAGGQGGAIPGLTARLVEKCARAHVTHDEAELLALLESRAVDYAFLFRSTAEDHRLKLLALPPEINLSRPEMKARYAAASVEIRMKQGQGKARLVGAPVTYVLTIPTKAPHPEPAARFAAFLLGAPGRHLLERRGFRPLAQAHCAPCTGLPAVLARKFFHAIQMVIYEAARKDNVVIVGRGGQVLLKGIPGILHVRIIAPLQDRIQRLMAESGESEKELSRILKQSDRESGGFLRAFLDADWENPELYDLTISTRNFPRDLSVDIILRAISAVEATKDMRTSRPRERLDDLILQLKVEAVLLNADIRNIRVEVGAGVVTLRGNVFSSLEGRRYVSLISRIEAVQKVESNMSVYTHIGT